MQQKIEFLNFVKTNVPDMKVHYLNQVDKKFWEKEKIISELNEEEIDRVNLRKQLPNEIILDIEEKFRLEAIEKKLNELDWSYEVWDSGSRGLHIKLLFLNLADKEPKLREEIRRHIINLFSADERLAREKQWLALEWAKHFKTNNIKTLIKNIIGKKPNEIPKDIVEYCIQILALNNGKSISSTEDFNDFINDPYLQFALTNKILDGGRNDMLFKNLAIGLVKSGMDRDKIVDVANKIVANCPGKNVNEFMGWVEKAFSGELPDYNKSELVQWSLRFNHPVLYKMWDEAGTQEMLDAKILWDLIWEHNITGQEIWRDLAFYNLIGTLLDERTDDLRIHVIFSSYSTSGKDEGLDLIQEILDKMGYVTSRPGTATDRTIVGSINYEIIKYNVKWGLDEETKTSGNKVWKNPEEKGVLERAHWLAFGESESVFKPNAWNRQLQLYLRQAMDKRRQVEKGVGGREMKINTNTSIIMTTYPLPDIMVKVLNNGLFQRCLFYHKEIDKEMHKKIVKHIIRKRFDNNIKKNFNVDEYKLLLIDRLKMIKKWYDANKDKLDYYKQSQDYVNRLWDEFDKDYDLLPEVDKMIMDSIVRRSTNTLYKLVVLNASWKMKLFVTIKDIKECFSLLKNCLDSIKILVLKEDKHKKREWGALKYLMTNGSMTTTQLHEILRSNLEVSNVAVRESVITKLMNMNYITMFKGEKNTRFYSITERGKQLILLGEDE